LRHLTPELQLDLDRDELAKAVSAILATSKDRLVADSIAFSPSPYASSHPLLDVAISVRGKLLHLVMKDMGAPSAAAEAARPEALQDPGREADIYAKVLGPVDGPPLCYGALHTGRRHWLLLERVRGRELTKVGDRRVWSRTARWLGRFHGSNSGAHIGLQRSEEHFRYVLQQATPAIEAAPSHLRLGRVVTGWAGITQSLVGMHASLLHGDAFPANVLVGHAERICFVDWELAGRGPSLIDLAALTSGSWTASERELMLNAYAMGLKDVAPTMRRDFGHDFLLCRVLVAVEMVGALRRWEPPSHQRWDWARELSGLADVMGL
jgi:hypothetical protein